MLKRVYFYTFYEMLQEEPFVKANMITFLARILGIESDPPVFTNYQVPNDLSDNSTIYNELLSLIYGRYYNDCIIKIVKYFNEVPSVEEIDGEFHKWCLRFISKLNLSYEYYMPLLKFYRSAQANLMDDITALTSNSVKFNDTPQNANTGDVYEGDNYITNFTKSTGTTSSPMMSKIMRLKEIQDNYKNVMRDWVNAFEELFFASED